MESMWDEAGAFCRTVSEEPRVGQVSATIFALAVCQLLISLLVLYWLRRQRNLAMIGSRAAAKRLVLPFYFQALWLFAFSNLLSGILVPSIPWATRPGQRPTWARCETRIPGAAPAHKCAAVAAAGL